MPISILVMDQGEAIEQGKHAELFGKKKDFITICTPVNSKRVRIREQPEQQKIHFL